MLTHLSLTNVAVFEQAEVPFGPGLTVIAGEAGSGKSLLLDGLDWVLGGNVSPKEVLRAGSNQGRVEATWVWPQLSAQLQVWLEENGIEPEKTSTGFSLTLSREFTEASSRCRAEGVLVSRPALEGLRALLLELQSQHAATELFKPATQRQILDAQGGEQAIQLKSHLQQAFEGYKKAKTAWQNAQTNTEVRERRLAQLQEEVALLERIAPQSATEDEGLRAELERISQAEELAKQSQAAVSLLQGENTSSWGSTETRTTSVLEALSSVERPLGILARLDKSAQPWLEAVLEATETLRDCAQQVNHYYETLEAQPERLNELGERLNDLERLKRQFGPTLAEVLTHWEQASFELADLEAAQNNPQQLQEAYHQAQKGFEQALAALTQARQYWATLLQAQVQALLEQMALPYAKLQVALEPINNPTAEGAESVVFLFSANPGEPLRPLAKVASGGELSRVLLALTVMESAETQAPKKLYGFDEIDTGTSGQVARTMAEQLYRLSKPQNGVPGQVWVITHQPLVAAMADTALLVEKQVSLNAQGQERSVSSVRVMGSFEERQAFLSRLASGEDAQHVSLANFATRLLEQADEVKQELNSAKTASLLSV